MAEDIARAQGCSEVADLLSKLTSVSKLVSLGPTDDVTLSRDCDAALWIQLYLVLCVNLIPVPLSLCCLFVLLYGIPHLRTLSTYHSHHP